MRRTGIFLKRSGLFSVFSEVRCAKCSLFLVAIFFIYFLLHSHIINRSVYVDVFLMICIVLMQFRHWPNWAWGCSLHHCTSRDGNLYISETLPQTQRGGHILQNGLCQGSGIHICISGVTAYSSSAKVWKSFSKHNVLILTAAWHF